MLSYTLNKETGEVEAHDKHLQPPASEELPPVIAAAVVPGEATYCELAQELGKKYDSGKLDWTLVPFSSLEGAVRVLMFGAGKYDRENWKLVKNGTQRYTAACLRHLLKHMDGEEFDPETGMRHTAHAMVNLLFIEWLHKEGK